MSSKYAIAQNYPFKNCSIALIGRPICTDCTDYRICMPNFELPAQKCPKDRPYCVQASVGDNCAIRPDLNIESCRNIMDKPDPIDCSSLGKIYVPDPKYCNFYHDCRGFGDKSIVIACPHDGFYNSKLERCDSNLSQKCDTINCSRNSLFSPYGDGFNRWYAYCDSFSEKITLFQCRPGFKMNYTTNICEFVCPNQRNGNFCDKNDFSMYYECYGPKNDWDQVAKTIYCPPGYLFHLIDRRCTLAALTGESNRYPSWYPSCNYAYRV